MSKNKPSKTIVFPALTGMVILGHFEGLTKRGGKLYLEVSTNPGGYNDGGVRKQEREQRYTVRVFGTLARGFHHRLAEGSLEVNHRIAVSIAACKAFPKRAKDGTEDAIIWWAANAVNFGDGEGFIFNEETLMS